jgi:NADH dehydrogenase
MSENTSTKVLIIGGGFGGLNAAKTLGGAPGISVTLIDQRNHHLFQPLLYQVATAGLSPADIATPLRGVLASYKNVSVLMDRVTNVLPDQKKVVGENGEYTYDYLILACGAKHSYFGNNRWEEFAPGLKTLEQATEVRRRILSAFEMAEKEPDKLKRNAWLTFVVVGGGPTGVEMAGAIGEISRFTLSKDFRHIDSRSTRIILVEGSSRLLGTFAPALSSETCRALEKLGVSVWTNKTVTDINAEGVQIGSEFIAAHTVVWAAGVRPADLTARLDFPKDKAGRIVVKEDLSVPSHPEIMVLGDQANFTHFDQAPLPGTCPVAIQQGKWAGRNILAETRGLARRPFIFNNLGSMATIGRANAVVQMPFIHFTGFFAWIAWLFIHILFLIGFKNRLVVFIQWAWSFITNNRGARLITEREWREFPK